MNAVPTLPVKPEMPATAAPTALHRDESPTAPSFMAALHKVKADKPLETSDEDHLDVSPTLPGEDQTASVLFGESPLETKTAESQAVVLNESPADLLPGGGLMEGAGPAIDGAVSSGAEKLPPGATATTPKDEQAANRPSDLKTDNAPIVPQVSGMSPTRPQTHLKNAAPAVFTTTETENANRDPGAAATQPSSTETIAKTAVPKAPEVTDAIVDSGSRAPETGEKGTQPTSAQRVTVGKRIPAQAGPGPHGPLAGDREAVQGQSEASTRTTMAPVTRLSEPSGRPADLAMPSVASNLTTTLGREPGKAASETPETTPSARLAVENAGPHDGPGLSADGESAEDHPRRWLGADQVLESARSARTARLETDARSDWISPVDRQGMLPVNKPSQPIIVEKAPTLAAESFRTQNLDPIVERIAVSVRGNQSEARIALKPDHLGSIRLQIATDNGTVSIKILTEFPMARDLLEAHLPQLKADLQQQGLDLEEFNVNLDNEEQHFRREDRRQQGAPRSPLGSGRRGAHSDRPDQDRPENHPTDKQSSATGVDFFA